MLTDDGVVYLQKRLYKIESLIFGTPLKLDTLANIDERIKILINKLASKAEKFEEKIPSLRSCRDLALKLAPILQLRRNLLQDTLDKFYIIDSLCEELKNHLENLSTIKDTQGCISNREQSIDIYVMNDVLLKNRAELEHIAIDIKQQSTEIDDMLELYEKMIAIYSEKVVEWDSMLNARETKLA